MRVTRAAATYNLETLAVGATLLLAHLPLAPTAFGQRPEGEAVESARAEVLATIESYYDAFSDRDWDRYASHFWPEATITTVWQPPGEDAPRVVVTSIEDYIELAPAGPGSREIFEERMLSADLTVRGTLATVYARYHARFGDPGAVSEWEGTDLFSLLKHDGAWRIVSLAFASDGG